MSRPRQHCPPLNPDPYPRRPPRTQVLLNPVILSGAASGYNTGMPPTDVALATA